MILNSYYGINGVNAKLGTGKQLYCNLTCILNHGLVLSIICIQVVTCNGELCKTAHRPPITFANQQNERIEKWKRNIKEKPRIFNVSIRRDL